MSTTHAKLSPSSAERWFNCPGSLNLIATLPASAFKTNKYAAQGSVEHKIAEDFVTGKIDLLTLTSRVGETVMHEGHEVEITDAMVEGVIEYVDHIAAFRKRLTKPAAIKGEAEIRVIASSVSEEVYGTADYLLYQVGNELHVFDYKGGKGVVEVEENKQGLIYVVGAADTIGAAFDKFWFHIVQPHARHNEGSTRPWEIPKARLVAFREELRAAVARTKDQKAPRAAGAWCKFCPALAYCPEASSGVQHAVDTVFTKLPAPPSKEVGQMSLPPVTALTPENVAKALDWEDTIDSWFEALRERAQADLAGGREVPGYKLVEGKTNRAWTSEEQVETAFAMLGDDRYNRKLKSPAQMEKIAGKEEVAKFTHKPAGKLTVAKADDKRQAVTHVSSADAAHVFGVLPGAKPAPVDEGNIFGDLAGPPAKIEPPKVNGVGDRRGPLWPQ